MYDKHAKTCWSFSRIKRNVKIHLASCAVAACCIVLQCDCVYTLVVYAHIKACRVRFACCVVAVCCSALQCVAVCCSVLQCVAVRCSVLQCVATCVAECCSVCYSAMVYTYSSFPRTSKHANDAHGKLCICTYTYSYIYIYTYTYTYTIQTYTYTCTCIICIYTHIVYILIIFAHIKACNDALSKLCASLARKHLVDILKSQLNSPCTWQLEHRADF